jgi:molybdopterin converting factor small subunit
MRLCVVISGRNYDAAQCVPRELTVPDGCSLDAALETLAGLMPADRPLSGDCLVAVSGTHVGTLRRHRPHVLREGDELLLLAPVAGG